MTKLQKLAQLELARRAVARELAEEELGGVAGGDAEQEEMQKDIGAINGMRDLIIRSATTDEMLRNLNNMREGFSNKWGVDWRYGLNPTDLIRAKDKMEQVDVGFEF